MFKQIKEFFMGKPVAAVEAPYKVEVDPVLYDPVVETAPVAAVAAPAKKTRKPRAVKGPAVVKKPAAKAPAKKPAAKTRSKKV